jgi:CheY-like chemotaxis protein
MNICPAKFDYAEFVSNRRDREFTGCDGIESVPILRGALFSLGTATVMQDSSAATTCRTVLIVDDNEPTAKALAKVLGAAKFETAVYYRGGEAVEYAKSKSICAAVVDIHLPDLSGLVVTQKLRQHLGAAVPIIILSGDTSMETLNSLPHVGATYFFSKPVNSAQLVERLQTSLDSGAQV